MAKDNARSAEEFGALEAERKLDKSNCPSRSRDQRGAARVKDKFEEGRLPTPPPDPQCSPVTREYRSGMTSRGPEEEEEDLTAYLGELGTSPFDGHSFDYDTVPNSTTSAMGSDAIPFTEEAFEHLDRLCMLTEQILELRARSSEYFRRVRNLERAKVQRNANRRLEIALANGEELYHDFADKDTGFAESLLDAMLSNCRDTASSTPRRNERSSVRSSARQRSRSLVPIEQNLGSRLVEQTDEADKRSARNANRNGGPKVSKWTRVKAAFKWERACTNDLADIAELDTPTTTSPSTTTRYLRIPDVTTTGSWSTGSALSPCTSEISSPSTPIGRISSASSNDDVFDDSRKNIVIYSDRQSSLMKDDKKRDDPDRYCRSLDTSVVENVDSTESHSEINRGKPLIRIISDTDARGNGKNSESSKKPMPILTITIPPNEDEAKSLSSPESMSPLPSSAQDSGGSSPQRPRLRQDILNLKEFKRQYSTIEEAVTPEPKIQQQDSKWNKVRRAFLTNATFSVPPSPIRMVATQSFGNDDTRRARSCSESIEDLGKTVAGINNNGNYREASRDYQALREKFGAEFHRKLIEWERLKRPQNVRNGFPLNEERLAPEFRKKLQDWKRAKKNRRSNVAIEQQRRRRLTDWQLWRSSSKPEPRCYSKNQNSVGSRESCGSIGSAGSLGSDGKQHLCEDFVKRMETWRRMSEAACRGERPKSPNRVASDIDESEFLALEKLLPMFEQRSKKELRESDARQLNDCFDGDSRFLAASRGVNCGNEVLIRTSVGSYRFEGISREFTRKLYDWEKYRGISPRSSTFRLLGPGYTPFVQDSDEIRMTEPSKNHAFHWTLKRSKSDGSVFEGSLRDESITLRRSTSLQSLTSAEKLEDSRINVLPISNKSQGIKDSEDMVVEDSEPEAMIVDIEDVIEETASPLAGVQPHQTPVYCVAASETTSIAVPLGTVTSSHEPSPVFLVKEVKNRERWNDGRIDGQTSSENSPSSEYLPANWHGKTSMNEEKSNWETSWCKDSKEDDDSMGWTDKTRRSIPDSSDSVKSDRSIGWNRDLWDELSDETNRDSMKLELSSTFCESESDRRKEDCLENDNVDSTHFTKSLEIPSTISNAEKFMDPPLTCKGMGETCKDETKEYKEKTENLAELSSNKWTINTKHTQNDEDDAKTKQKEIKLNADCCIHLPRTIPLSKNCNSTEISSKLLNLHPKDNKNTSECRGIDNESETSAHYDSCGSPELHTDADRHYEILRFKTETCDDSMDGGLYEPIDCYEIRTSYDNFTKETSLLPEMKKSSFPETSKSLLNNSTIQTIPITVARDSKTRCLEKILINEQTLNKIIVPTCTESGINSGKKTQDRFLSINSSEESAIINNYTSKKAIHDHQIESIKKDIFSTRNVFVKTKRMIFNPFRRSEEQPSSRKQSDSSVDSRLSRSSKSKSKSRSASPKMCRQDALLRVSLSLPWPLRSASKDSETSVEAESRRNSRSKLEDVTTTQKRNPLYEDNSVESRRLSKQSNSEEPFIDIDKENIHQSSTEFVTTPINTYLIETSARSAAVSKHLDRSKVTMTDWNQTRNEFKCNQIRPDDEECSKSKCNQVQVTGNLDKERNHNQKQEKRWREDKFNQKQNEIKQQDENNARCDAVPSDLMHKLKILSDVAAKREGRTSATEASMVSSLESRSSRIRRAKESFLSRRGGPFCRSVMEADSANPWERTSTSILGSNEITETVLKLEKPEDTRNQTEIMSTAEDKVGEDKVDACQAADEAIAVRSDSLVKSASAGMINVDPNTFDRLVTTDRGCESLPRTIAKRRDSSSPLAKIVGKLKFSRLIRARNIDSGNMSTITTLCRQSLLIDMRNVPENRQNNERDIENDLIEDVTDNINGDQLGESSKTIRK